MEDLGLDNSPNTRRFNLFRSFSRGLKAACRWTVGLGRGRSEGAGGRKMRRRARRGAPPLASLSAAMLEPRDFIELGEETLYGPPLGKGRRASPPSAGIPESFDPSQLVADGANSGGSTFPLILRRPFHIAHESPGSHLQPRTLSYHINADGFSHVYQQTHQHHHSHHRHPDDVDDVDNNDAPWLHHRRHHRNDFGVGPCTCGTTTSGRCCDSLCPASATGPTSVGQAAGATDSWHRTAQAQQGPSLQHLLAVGSRQWGSGGWWDGRGLLRVKIYDFAVYADTTKVAQALCGPPTSSEFATLPWRSTSGSDGASPTSLPSLTSLPSPGVGRGVSASSLPLSASSAAERLASPASGVDASLTIRACRNLPLTMLSQEFERILQRRHEKAGGCADDPALRELLSYFSRERLPPHVVTHGSAPGDSDAVRRGAAITFSRGSSGELVTEAGGHVLGRLRSPALVEALFDLYLGDQPVSKKAKVAAGAALLRLATPYSQIARASGMPYRYQLQPGERLVCPPGAGMSRKLAPRGGPPGDVDACFVELP